MLSLAKITDWLNKPKDSRKAFSIHDIKAQYFNERFLNKIFSVFAITPELQLNNPNIDSLRNYAKIAAWFVAKYCIDILINNRNKIFVKYFKVQRKKNTC